MNFATWLLPLFFLIFLMIYQAAPEKYYEAIDTAFGDLNNKIDKTWETEFDSQKATISTLVDLLIKSGLYSLFALAIIVIWMASIVPLPAQDLLFIYIIVFIIGNIPWGIILGVGLLTKDWLDKRRQKK